MLKCLFSQVCLFALALGWSTSNVLAQPTHHRAIVQLQGMKLPPPKIEGNDSLPFTLLPQSLVYSIAGKVGSLDGNFLVDTGASTTLIAESAVRFLNLSGREVPKQYLSFAMAGNQCSNISATLHTLPPLTFQRVSIRQANGLRFKSKELPDKLTGILGMDILKYFDLQVNPPIRQLQLKTASQLPPALTPIAIPLQKRKGVFLAQIELANQGAFTMLLDTGAGSTFISQQVAQRLKLDQSSRRPLKIQGFCGLEDAERSHITSLRIGPHQQQHVEVIVLSSSILKLLGVDGILGQNVLERYRQYWRFTPTNLKGVPADGSLVLSAP